HPLSAARARPAHVRRPDRNPRPHRAANRRPQILRRVLTHGRTSFHSLSTLERGDRSWASVEESIFACDKEASVVGTGCIPSAFCPETRFLPHTISQPVTPS